MVARSLAPAPEFTSALRMPLACVSLFGVLKSFFTVPGVADFTPSHCWSDEFSSCSLTIDCRMYRTPESVPTPFRNTELRDLNAICIHTHGVICISSTFGMVGFSLGIKLRLAAQFIRASWFAAESWHLCMCTTALPQLYQSLASL